MSRFHGLDVQKEDKEMINTVPDEMSCAKRAHAFLIDFAGAVLSHSVACGDFDLGTEDYLCFDCFRLRVTGKRKGLGVIVR